MRTAACILSVSVCALILLTGAGHCTKIIYRGPKDLAQESSQIVRGRVASVRAFWNAEKTKILTEALVTVDETYKGAALREARILQLGGIVGHVNMRVEGALAWRPDEEVLLFLEPGMTGTFNVAGFSQGKFRIERDSRTGRAFVKAPGLLDVELVGKPRDAAPRRVGLQDFVDEAIGRR